MIYDPLKAEKTPFVTWVYLERWDVQRTWCGSYVLGELLHVIFVASYIPWMVHLLCWLIAMSLSATLQSHVLALLQVSRNWGARSKPTSFSAWIKICFSILQIALAIQASWWTRSTIRRAEPCLMDPCLFGRTIFTISLAGMTSYAHTFLRVLFEYSLVTVDCHNFRWIGDHLQLPGRCDLAQDDRQFCSINLLSLVYGRCSICSNQIKQA